MPVTSGVPLRLHRDNAVVSLRPLDAPSDDITSSTHATPFNQGTATVPADVRSDYSLPFSGRRYPPGLYTAIAHNVPLRTQIQRFSPELDEFWWHFRQARNLLFGWLAILCHLVLLAVWYTFISPIRSFVEMYSKRGENSVTSETFFTRRIKRVIFLRYIVMVWLLPILDKIRNFALDTFGTDTEGRSHDAGSPQVRVHSEGNGVASGVSMPADHTQVGNRDIPIGILLPERVAPTLLDYSAPTANHFSIRPGTSSQSLRAEYHAPARRITFLKACLKEHEW